mgnify:CR=1 FL=1
MDTKLSPDGFFWMRDGVLSPEFCDALIAKFEGCPDKHKGITLDGYLPAMKTSTDLMLSVHPDFEEEDTTIYTVLSLHARDYNAQLSHSPWKSNLRDTGYNMQRTEPGQQFIWHTDFFANVEKNEIRTSTFIFYLNDVEEGGETEFANGIIINQQNHVSGAISTQAQYTSKRGDTTTTTSPNPSIH